MKNYKEDLKSTQRKITISKLEKNLSILNSLIKKKENLEKNIASLESKIQNQKNYLSLPDDENWLLLFEEMTLELEEQIDEETEN